MNKGLLSSQNSASSVGLFVGCGGLDYGFQTQDIQPIWSNEIESDAAHSYEKLLGKQPKIGDIWNFIDDVPEAPVLVGGPPCQAFSLVGKRLEDDPRAKLVFAFLQVVRRIRPKVFVMENVPGILASKIDGKRLPEYLAEAYTYLGYDVQIVKLNAADFGVPQQRKRVIMIGTVGNKKFEMIPSEVFLSKLGFGQHHTSASEALSDLPIPTHSDHEAAEYATSPTSPFQRLIRQGTRGSTDLHKMPTMSVLDREFVRHIKPGGNYWDIPDEISTKRILRIKETGGRTTTYGRLHPDRPAYTLNTYFNRPNVGANYHYEQERLITVREALRIQSFPDHFKPIFSNQRSLHMQVGNAVPPLLAQALATSVKKVL